MLFKIEFSNRALDLRNIHFSKNVLANKLKAQEWEEIQLPITKQNILVLFRAFRLDKVMLVTEAIKC